MFHTYSTTDANFNSAEYRLAQRTAQLTIEQRVAHLRRITAELREAGLAWTRGYQDAAADLARLEEEAR